MEASPYFRHYTSVVEKAVIQKLLSSHRIQLRTNPRKRPKTWGIDQSTTPLAFTLARLHSNTQDKDGGP